MRKFIQYAVSAVIFCGIYSGVSAKTSFPYEEGKPVVLKGGVYVVNRDITINTNEYKDVYAPAISIAKNSVVTMEIPENVTLTAIGRNAQNFYYKSIYDFLFVQNMIAFPGIELPSGSTLIVKGKGKLIATGGQGCHDGSDGLNGQEGNYECHMGGFGGHGGLGGLGGYGSAPGIGTCGGKGGEGGGASPSTSAGNPTWRPYNFKTITMSDKVSPSGADGENSTDMGILIVLGSVQVVSTSGRVSAFQQTHAKPGPRVYDSHSGSCYDYLACGGGGGGGQGGASIRAKYGIGAGAPGSGGGGTGGTGGLCDEYWWSNVVFYGGSGGGGGRAADGSIGGTGQDAGNNGGKGGNGGNAGKRGKDGMVYFTTAVVFNTNDASVCLNANASKSLDSLDREKALALLPPEEHRKITGATWGSQDNLLFCYGMALNGAALKVEVPNVTDVFHFEGLVDQYGNQIYDSEGKLNIVKMSSCFPYEKDRWGKWYIYSEEDIILHKAWKNKVRVYVSHYLEDPNFQGSADKDCYTLHAPVVCQYREYDVPKGEILNLSFSKFKDMDGNPLDFNKDNHYCIAENEKETITVSLDGTQSRVEVCHLYDCNKFKLDWDYSDQLSEEEFHRLLLNKDSYTRSGMVKYGKEVYAPQLKKYKDKEYVCWQDAMDGYRALQGTMPNRAVKGVLRDSIKAAKYLIGQKIDQSDTECSITCSKLTDIAYQEPVDITLHFVGDTRISYLNVTDDNTGNSLTLSQKNDSVYSFLMPGNDVTVNVRFVNAHYGLITSISNKELTKVAVKDSEGVYYTDDNDYFHFADSLFGGKMKDLGIYQNEKITIIAEIDQKNVNTDETDIEEFRPLVQVHFGNDKYDNCTEIKSELHDNRMYRSYEYTIEEAASTHVKVVWTNRIKKKIDFSSICDGDYYAEIGSIFTDFNPDILRNDKISATACYNDVVCFTVDTDDPKFDIGNVVVSYEDAYGEEKFVPVRTLSNPNDSDAVYYLFKMPDRNTAITLYTGEKVKVSSNLPGSDDLTPEDDAFISASNERAIGYRVIMPEYAVVGSKVPYFVVKTTAHNDIHNPIAVYEINKAAKSNGFKYYKDVSISETNNYGQGSFIVPKTEEVELRNGIVTSYNPGYLWICIYNMEAISLPYWLNAYTVVAHPDHTFEMSQVYGGAVPKNCAVIISFDPEWLESFMHATDQSTLILDTDPNIDDLVMNENDLRGVSRTWACKELRDSLYEENGAEYDIYLMRYDPVANAVSFVIAPDDEFIYQGTAYLPMLHDGNNQPIMPTGIETIHNSQWFKVQGQSQSLIYNLKGIRVEKNPSIGSGQANNVIVIKNGKKIFRD